MRKYLAFSALLLAAALFAAFPASAQAPFNQQQFSVTAAGTSAQYCSFDPQRFSNGAGAALLVNFSAGASATVTVQISGDLQYNTVNSGNGYWNSHDTLVNLTSSANGNIQFPVTFARLNVTAYTSGTITLTCIQPAIPR